MIAKKRRNYKLGGPLAWLTVDGTELRAQERTRRETWSQSCCTDGSLKKTGNFYVLPELRGIKGCASVPAKTGA